MKIPIILLIITIMHACSSSMEKEKKDEDNIVSVNSKATVTKVKTIIADRKSFEYLVQSNGKIKPVFEQVWAAQTGGVLKTFSGTNGKFYAGGSLIAAFETTVINLKLERANLSRYNAEKEYQSQLLGYGNLLAGKSKEETEAIKKKLSISSGLATAELEIKEVSYELEKATISAPFEGILADVKVRQGELVKTGQELFKLYAANELMLEIKVLEGDVILLRKGQPAIITPVANSSFQYNAFVQEINPYVDENGMVLIKLKIRNVPVSGKGTASATLFPGMNCTATIKVPGMQAIVVPKESVIIRNGKSVVFTLENGLAKWNYVTTGRDNGKEIEIKDGLRHGQKAIITNNLQLTHDTPVEEEKLLSRK